MNCTSLLRIIAARLLLVGLVTLVVPAGWAAATSRTIDNWAEDYLAFREGRGFGQKLSLAEGQRIQKEFVRRLQPKLGPPAGYKVGLVTREAQEKYGVDGPLRGVLLEKMLLPNGADVPHVFAVRPILEADLVVVVKDKAINKAKTLIEAAEHLKEIVAFIELPDAFIPTNPPPNGALLTAGNVGARLGILGQRIPVTATADFVKALGEMTAIITDNTGAELGRGQGSVILDHPLNALLWLIEELNRAGDRLKPGEMISLGSIKAVPVPGSGKSVTVRYLGLPGGPISVSARFL